ncbi:MAG: IMPACT family protein [Flavobacteriales bacterium]
MSTYRTIAAATTAQYRVLGSRHLGYAYSVRSEEEIKSYIDALWKEHHNATHVCYAWRLGWDYSKYRINDDGEPSGTAGKPIFGQIQSAELSNILIAVVRYYGGTKLGTGGLIDAYKTTAKLCIDEATIEVRPVKDRYRITFGYSDMPAVMKVLKDLDMEKNELITEADCMLDFNLSMTQNDALQKAMEEWSTAELVHLGRT